MKIIEKTNQIILKTTLFAVPLFFLTLTSDIFYINKQYLLVFSVFFLIILSSINLLLEKKILWQNHSLDKYLIFFFIPLVLSVTISSPNKIQAIINQNFGLATIFVFVIFYFYLSRQDKNITWNFFPIILSSLILSLLTIILFLNPFNNINLPSEFQFLKNPLFTPLGSQIDLTIFLGFTLIINIINLIKNKQSKNKIYVFFNLSTLIINLAGLLTAINNIFRLLPETQSSLFQNLPPLDISWYASVEILKNPLTLFFGVGLDNFSSIFTKIKTILYNQSQLWQISSFDYSRLGILQILTETGIIGLISFLVIAIKSIILSKNHKSSLLIFVYSILIFFILPLSFIVWFIFFISLSLLKEDQEKKTEINLSQVSFICYGLSLFLILIIAVSSYLLMRHYLSEFNFKKSIEGVLKNNLKEVYENQRQAIILNPYIEKYHINFSQTNLIIANNLIQTIKSSTDTPTININDQERQSISQAIQQAIFHAKDGAVNLNPKKALNWQNLGEIYKNIIGFAQNADLFSIASYERAIILDPQNPVYRLNLGSVYYITGRYEDAVNLFNQAISFKPDWPNAYYNLAWSYYQKQEIEKAVSAMENVIKLIDKEKNKQDFEIANQDLELFKNKLKEKEENRKNQENTQLKLPEIPKNNLDPKININN